MKLKNKRKIEDISKRDALKKELIILNYFRYVKPVSPIAPSIPVKPFAQHT